MVFKTDSKSALFGYSGSCRAVFDFQLSGVHLPGAAVGGGGERIGVAATGVLDGSAAKMGWRWCLLIGRREKVGWWVWEEGLKRDWDWMGESDVVFDRAIVGFASMCVFVCV